MYKDERDIYFYDIASRVWTKRYTGLHPFAHYELAKAIQSMYENDRAEYIQKGTLQSIYITDLKLHIDRCEILVGFSDTRAADPTLNDRPARKRRVVQKQGSEGIEHSAHIIWHFGNKTNDKLCGFYLEGATGLRSTTIARFFNRLLREYAAATNEFTIPDPEGAVDSHGNYKRIKTRPRIELLGHPSQEFLKDLKKGDLTEVELYTESHRNSTWDSHGHTLEDRRSVIIKPNPQKILPKAKSLLDGVFTAKVKGDYEFARVSFKTETNVARSVRVLSDNYRLINDDSYVKKERIDDLGGNLPNAFDKFHPIIMTKMRVIAGI
jgi:hypothetical protein